MEKVISVVNELKESEIKDIVDSRMKEFELVGDNEKEIFRELCFCILTAGTSAELGIKTIEHLGETIFEGRFEDIQKKLKEVYRFHTIRARYIHEARESFNQIDLNSENVREELVKNIKGLGMKEASHFLRNIGFKDYAIIDFHIIDFLVRQDLIEKPKSLNRKKYLEIENILRNLAEKTDLPLGELDLYLWYLETGKVLK